MTSQEQLQALFIEAQRGEEDSFRALYTLLAPQVFRFIRPRARSREEALDVLQETFVDFWKGLPRFRYENDRALLSLLYRIAIRKLFRFFRLWRAHSSLDEIDDVADEGGDTHAHGDVLHVTRALAELSMSDRAIITLRAIEGRPFAEISQLLGQSENALKVRYHRALTRLRKYATL